MKKILLILILTFSFQSWTKANDIRDFQIEGISVGDSLLEYFSEGKIEEEKSTDYVYNYKDNKFIKLGIGYGNAFALSKKIEIYDELSVVVKPNDKSYKIYSISGQFFCEKDIKICFSKQKKILSDLKVFFGNQIAVETYKTKHRVDTTGNSIVYNNEFIFQSTKDIVVVSIYDWSEKMVAEKKWIDRVTVDISLADFVNFIRYEAYN